MGVIVERAGFGADRQFVDVRIALPDSRPGWMAVLQAKGAQPVFCPMQPCLPGNGADATVRFYPFFPAGDYAMAVGLVLYRDGEATTETVAAADIGWFSVPALDVPGAAEWLGNDGADLARAASRALLPVCVDGNGAPCFWPLRGPSPKPVAVLSVPKSGTYLLAKLLDNLGVVNCRIHVTRGRLSDSRLQDAIPTTPVRYLDLAFSSRLVLPGQSVASHTARELASDVCLHGFSKLFAYRELRAALVSSFRATRRNRTRVLGRTLSGAKLKREVDDTAKGFAKWLGPGLERMRPRYETVAGWYEHPDICRVPFEDIMGDAGPRRQRDMVMAVAAHCGVALPEASVDGLLERTIGTKTVTYSGERSSVDTYWTPQAEAQFKAAGLDKLNRVFGYT